jgi:hypothetical protein
MIRMGWVRHTNILECLGISCNIMSVICVCSLCVCVVTFLRFDVKLMLRRGHIV